MKKSAVLSFTPFRNFSKVCRGINSKGSDLAVEESQPCSSASTKPITYEPLPILETPILPFLRSAMELIVLLAPVEIAQPIVLCQSLQAITTGVGVMIFSLGTENRP